MREHNRIVVQAPTGFGKTVVSTEMIKRIVWNGLRVWYMMPRRELLQQASNHLRNADIVHGRIDAGGVEQRGVKAHVVSKDTIIRRYDKIGTPPDYLLIDECHIALERQLEIIEQLGNPKVIGMTATPEQFNGKSMGLVYGDWVPGPQLHELVELGRLSEPRIFCPPIEGIENLHRKGSEYNEDEFDEFLEEKKVYGDAIRHYEKHANGKPAIIFARSVKAAKKIAKNFQDAGHNFESIDGSMTMAVRHGLLDSYRRGELTGLVSCQLLTYGVDLPTIEYIGLLRLTLSKALWYQMIGRGLRVSRGKSACIIMDHVNNLLVHGHPLVPYEWQFWGRGKFSAKRDKEEIMKLCPANDYMYCTKASCVGCEFNSQKVKTRQEMHVDVDLQEMKAPVNLKMKDRPGDEQRELAQKIEELKTAYKLEFSPGAVGDLMKIARDTSRDVMWVYWYLSEGMRSVNVKLLYEIARQQGIFKNWSTKQEKGWAYFKRKLVREKLEARFPDEETEDGRLRLFSRS